VTSIDLPVPSGFISEGLISIADFVPKFAAVQACRLLILWFFHGWSDVHTESTEYCIYRDRVIAAYGKESDSTPKNVTIYLPDEIAEKMEKFPEVNWSEICRKALVDYTETRSQMDLAPILERLKKEQNEDHKRGQIFFYSKFAPKIAWREFEEYYPLLNRNVLSGRPHGFLEGPLIPEVAEVQAVDAMRAWLILSNKKADVEVPDRLSTAFCEGAIEAFMDIYHRMKHKQIGQEKSKNVGEDR
jgi:hypothetical protein